MVSRLTVVVIAAIAIVVLAGLHFFMNQYGEQGRLASISCRKLLSTTFQLQGKPVLMSSGETCDLIRTIVTMRPLADEYHNDPSDPWHYFGRLRIRPEDDVWFLVFVAKRSESYRPLFALLHRNGPGWSVVGLFDAAPVLRQLGVYDKIDWGVVKSDASLTPTDQTTPM